MGKSLDFCSPAPAELQEVSNRNNPCEDRISCLPDEILYFIQSLLDYNNVAQMSILSHRWFSLWKHAPRLQFGAPILLDLHLRVPILPDRRNQNPDCEQLVSTIKRVSDRSWKIPKRECKLLHRLRHPVKNQNQECDKSAIWMTSHTPDERNQKGECDKIMNWISRVSQMPKGQNLKEPRVCYTLYKSYKKKDIESWWEDTLVGEFQSLELNFTRIDCQDSSYVFPDRLLSFCSDCFFWTLTSDAFDSDLLESSGFKSLKSLSLNGILITHESLYSFLSDCPFLERLEVVGSPVLDFFKIRNFPSLALKYLKMEECENLRIIEIINCNIVSIIIGAPSWLTLKKLPRLTELSIDGNPSKVMPDFLCQPNLQTLTRLTLSPYKPKGILKQFNVTSQLTKLKRLVINTHVCGDKSLNGLIAFINACPLLEEFVLKLTWIKRCRSSKMVTEKPEKCPIKHLKVVEFLGYYGRVSDAELIVYLMENADNLEKVIVDPWNPKHIHHFFEEEAEATSLALQQLKEYAPPLVELIIR